MQPNADESRLAAPEQAEELAKAIRDMPMIEFASISVENRTSGSEANTSLVCQIRVSGELGTPLPNVVLKQIANTAAKTIEGLRLSDVAIIDLNWKQYPPSDTPADESKR